VDDRREIRGHFEECLHHFVMKGGGPNQTQGKQLIADFCGVSLATVATWFRGSNLPVGERYIKFMCFLDMAGYRVIELERMPKALRNIAEFIGYGVLSTQEVMGLLEYSNRSKFFALLRGERGISKEKEQKAWNIWKEKRGDLEKRKEEARELYQLDIPPTSTAPAVNIQQELPKVSVTSTHHKSGAVVSLMEGLLALLEDASFELAEINQSVGTVLRLSARLSSLSSELIAKLIAKKHGEGEGYGQ